jgi:hypothetical protein
VALVSDDESLVESNQCGRSERREGRGVGDDELLHERSKALEGRNPMSGAGMKQGRQVRDG